MSKQSSNIPTRACLSSTNCLLPQKSFQSAFIVKPLALEGVLMGLRGGSLEGVGCPWSVSLVQDFFSLISGHFLASSLPLESVYHVIHLVVNGPRLYTLFFSILTKRSNINKDVYILVTLLLYIQLALLHYVRIIIIGICSTQLLINVKEKDKVKDFV